MKTLTTTTIFAFALALSVTSCKDEVQQAADCTKATESLTAADKTYATSPTKENCLAVNTAISVYRTECEKLPDGHDSINCTVYDVLDVIK